MTAVHILKKLSLPIIGILAIVGLLVASGQADALFSLTGNTLRATGTIVDVNSDSLLMDTGSTDPPFEILVDRHTYFRGGIDELTDLEVGDDVEVRARNRDGVFEGRRVELLEGSGYGYGGGCERLRVQRATVISFSLNEIVVEREGIEISAAVNDNTRIRGYRGNRLADPGDSVDLRGEDCGGNFVADRITIRRPHGSESHSSNDVDGYHHSENESE